MQYEVIIQHYACALFHKAVSVRDAATIRDVAPLHLEPLTGIVPRMQSDCDAYNTRTAGGFNFCAIKQTTCDTFSTVFCEHIEVLNFGNVQVGKSGVSRSPAYRHVPGELPAIGRVGTGLTEHGVLNHRIDFA
jgi:hypothetical protein